MTDDEWEDDDEKTPLRPQTVQESVTSDVKSTVKGVPEGGGTRLKGSKYVICEISVRHAQTCRVAGVARAKHQFAPFVYQYSVRMCARLE